MNEKAARNEITLRVFKIPWIFPVKTLRSGDRGLGCVIKRAKERRERPKEFNIGCGAKKTMMGCEKMA